MIVLKVDENGVILSGEIRQEGPVVLDMDTYVVESLPAGDIHDYKYVNGEFVYSPREETLRNEKLSRIDELKAYLSATDYAVIKIVEGVAQTSEYEAILDARQECRNEINRLEAELSEQN